MKRRRSNGGPREKVPGVARELPLSGAHVAPEALFPRWVRRTLAVAVIVATMTLASHVALYWTVGDDWGWRCGPDHPQYNAAMSENFGPSCQEPSRL